jgi:stage II sporulation protein D
VRKKKHLNVALIAVIAVILLTGTYALLRPPAEKIAPTPQNSPSTPQPIPGVPAFDVSKYKSEPTVSVWLADKGSSVSMPLEKYLEGVIAKEMDPGWPLEALQAQAVASRTLTIHAIETGIIRKIHNTDVSTAKEELQAYAPEKVNDTVRQAVASTRGQILLYAGSLVNAIYSSSNGQIAATKEESFPKEIPYDTPYFQPVTDNSFKYTPVDIQNWTVSIAEAEVAAAVGYAGNPGDISIMEKGPSGRILYIGAGNNRVYGSDFRKTIGFDRLKSTLITDLKYEQGQYVFKGSGWGNGVGLCQWGAYTYAKDGMKAEEILMHYYVGTEIHKLWD